MQFRLASFLCFVRSAIKSKFRCHSPLLITEMSCLKCKNMSVSSGRTSKFATLSQHEHTKLTVDSTRSMAHDRYRDFPHSSCWWIVKCSGQPCTTSPCTFAQPVLSLHYACSCHRLLSHIKLFPLKIVFSNCVFSFNNKNPRPSRPVCNSVTILTELSWFSL